MNKLTRLFRHDLPLHFVLLFTNWLPDNVPFLKLRGWLASHFLGSCGSGLELGRNITFYNPSQIHIGNNVYIAYGCWFMAEEAIRLEDEVLFGPFCVIVSSNHTRGRNGSFRFTAPDSAPIHVGFGSWIAAHVTLTAGAIVGHGSLIAAGAVVTMTIPNASLAAGQPAKVLKTFNVSE